MRYTIEKEKEVRKLAADGKSSSYISSLTGIPERVIWNWCPETRPHDDVIKWSVKQRYHSIIPELEARISAAISPIVRDNVSEEEWENVNQVINRTLFEEAIIVFKNLLSEPPEFGSEKKLSKEPFLDYLRSFWSENSEYVQQKNLSSVYVKQNYDSIHFWSLIKKRALCEVNKGDIERVYEKLSEKQLSQSRINAIMKAGLVPLKYAYKNGLILNRSYEFCLPNPEKCNAISGNVAVKIFNAKWNNEEAFVANLIAYICKMQLQEVKALRIKDIGCKHIDCENIFTNKLTDNPNKRTIETPSTIIDIILKYTSTSPYPVTPDSFVFFSEYKNKPAHGKKWNSELISVCNALNIEEKVNFKTWCR